MKFIFTIFLIFLVNLLNAQTKTFIIKDAVTNKPIAFANVYYPNQMLGSISNEEGRVKVPVISSDTLVFSYIGYEIKKILANTLNGDTIKLNPKTIALGEVKVYSIDLRKKLINVLATYGKNYYKAKLYDATYKESFKVNSKLVRLSQVQLKWWDKNYRYNFKERFDKQSNISLTAIDYSKRLDNKGILSNSGYLENKYFFELLHLNHYLKFLIDYGKDISIDNIEEFKDFTKVVFNARINLKGKEVSYLKKGVIYFDKQTGAISKLSFELLYNTKFKKALSTESKIPYETKTQGQNIELAFTENVNKKWSLSFFSHQLYGIVRYNNISDNVYSKQDLYITKIHLRGRIPEKQRIDLNKPFYDNLPMYRHSDAKILLTKEEQDFLKRKD